MSLTKFKWNGYILWLLHILLFSSQDAFQSSYKFSSPLPVHKSKHYMLPLLISLQSYLNFYHLSLLELKKTILSEVAQT